MGQDNAISASVKNNGVEAVDGWKAMLYADGEPVDSLSGEEIEAFADTILTFNYHPSVTETKDSVQLLAKVTFGADEGEISYTTKAVNVRTSKPDYPVATELTVQENQNTATLNWTAP